MEQTDRDIRGLVVLIFCKLIKYVYSQCLFNTQITSTRIVVKSGRSNNECVQILYVVFSATGSSRNYLDLIWDKTWWITVQIFIMLIGRQRMRLQLLCRYLLCREVSDSRMKFSIVPMCTIGLLSPTLSVWTCGRSRKYCRFVIQKNYCLLLHPLDLNEWIKYIVVNFKIVYL